MCAWIHICVWMKKRTNKILMQVSKEWPKTMCFSEQKIFYMKRDRVFAKHKNPLISIDMDKVV